MPMGPGKYDDLCSLVRKITKAQGAIIIVFGGDRGTGFSAQLDFAATMKVPDVLEDIAAQIRESRKEGEL